MLHKKTPTVAQFLNKAIDESEKTQQQIAEEVGFPRRNMVSMLKLGTTKLPIGRIPKLARALGIEPRILLQLAMEEYQPGTWDVIVEIFGAPA